MNEIKKLQEQVAFQELTIEQLNDALANQQQQISRLSEELRLAVKLMQQWRSENPSGAGEGDNQAITHEIPPHY